MDNFKHNATEILKPRDLNVNQGKQNNRLYKQNQQRMEMCEYLGSMRETGEDIK